MPDSWDDTELGAQECVAELRHDFLTHISLTTKAVRETAVETR